jgi:hypothetical protein
MSEGQNLAQAVGADHQQTGTLEPLEAVPVHHVLDDRDARRFPDGDALEDVQRFRVEYGEAAGNELL